MTRKKLQSLMRSARTLEACDAAEEALRRYLQDHPDDEDIRIEAGSLYRMRTAIERLEAQKTAQSPVASKTS